eukprot:1320921-Rhodomonas_salina.4
MTSGTELQVRAAGPRCACAEQRARAMLGSGAARPQLQRDGTRRSRGLGAGSARVPSADSSGSGQQLHPEPRSGPAGIGSATVSQSDSAGSEDESHKQRGRTQVQMAPQLCLLSTGSHRFECVPDNV